MEYAALDGRAASSADLFHDLAGNIYTTEAAQKYNADLREVVAVKQNIDYLLGLTGGRGNKEMER